jgi:hypothetical protein
MRISLVVRFAVGALAATAACTVSSPSPYAQVSEYCTAYAKAVCQISATCQFAASTCEAYQTSQCTVQAAQAMAARAYVPGNVKPCIDALNAAYGNGATSVTIAQLTNIDSVCAKVFPGAAAEGAPCMTAADCVTTGAVCASAPGITGQTCALPTQKQLNDVCADPGDVCPANAYCAPMAGTSKCVAAQMIGQACSATQPCDTADYCDRGTCAALAAQGAPCATSANCAPGLFCDTYTSATVGTACVTAYTFARGSVDCEGFEGNSTNSGPGDAGTTHD